MHRVSRPASSAIAGKPLLWQQFICMSHSETVQTAASPSSSNQSVARRRIMKLILPALLFSVLLTGCARTYVITMNNGARVTTKGKPKLQGSTYFFKDAQGGSQFMRQPGK
jgi:hypothetical protein